MHRLDKVPKSKQKQLSGLNKGTHTAAKSSPILLNDGTFLQAGDTGILYRFNIHTGKTIWSAAQNKISIFGYHSTPCVVYGVDVDRNQSSSGTAPESQKKDLVIIGSYAG